MENIRLEGRVIEPHYGRNADKAPALLERWEKGEGYIPSEGDIRLLGVRNFKKAPEIATNYWNTSTLLATKGKEVKVILPYNNSGNHELTESARLGLSLINPNERLVDYGVNLDTDDRWEKLDGSGVYTLQRKGLVINQDLKEEQAMQHPLLLTKLGHPDHVDAKFARSSDEVAEIIGKTFELGKSEHGYDTMMGQYLPNESKKGVMNSWYVFRLGNRSRSNISWGADLYYVGGRFAFNSVGDAGNDAEDVVNDRAKTQLKTLEGMLKQEQIDQIGMALNERDQLRERLLTTDQIYSVIEDYVASANESEVRKVLDDLTSQ